MTILYDLPADLFDIDARLDNWGQWARTREGGKHTAQSAEGHYRRKADEDDPRRTPLVIVDAKDALLIGRVIAPAAGMPWREFRLLHAHYVYHADYRVTCRRLGLHWNTYQAAIRKALYMARNRAAKDGREQ